MSWGRLSKIIANILQRCSIDFSLIAADRRRHKVEYVVMMTRALDHHGHENMEDHYRFLITNQVHDLSIIYGHARVSSDSPVLILSETKRILGTKCHENSRRNRSSERQIVGDSATCKSDCQGPVRSLPGSYYSRETPKYLLLWILGLGSV